MAAFALTSVGSGARVPLLAPSLPSLTDTSEPRQLKKSDQSRPCGSEVIKDQRTKVKESSERYITVKQGSFTMKKERKIIVLQNNVVSCKNRSFFHFKILPYFARMSLILISESVGKMRNPSSWTLTLLESQKLPSNFESNMPTLAQGDIEDKITPFHLICAPNFFPEHYVQPFITIKYHQVLQV